jgi:hypothetical protein
VHRNLMVISVWVFGEGGTANFGGVCVRTPVRCRLRCNVGCGS